MAVTNMLRIVATLCAGILVSTHANAQNSIPTLPTSQSPAEVGEYVLCPSRQFYDADVKSGFSTSTFIYYAAVMVVRGEHESKVRNLAGKEFSLPNAMMIAIPKGQKAKRGDILLSWWQSGSGMQRCIVVGGSPEEPTVRYLDVAYDNPSGVGTKEDTLKPDSFYVLDKPMQIGTTVTVKTPRQERFGQLVAMDNKKVMLREFAGKLKIYDRALVKAMPLRPKLSAGDAADAALFGSMKPVTVVKVDAKIGRVFTTYQLGRTEKQRVFSFGEIK
ncbi:MAG: hypothetical protein ABJZ55_15205 [Fuerstiella sp.]